MSADNVSLFQQELSELLNKHSVENQSDTPDFILAEYMMSCLKSFNRAIFRRDNWYGHKTLTRDNRVSGD